MSDKKPNLSRRSALRLIATTAVAAPVVGCADKVPETAVPAPPSSSAPAINKAASIRTATDPDLLNPTIPWDFVLEDDELKTLAALCDVIIPADSVSPRASLLGAHHYINEHVSAPYESNKADLILVRGGVVWLNSESRKRFGKAFADLSESQKVGICEDIKWEKTAAPQYRAGARFFSKVRNLTATAFYTTEEGMADIGYVGNIPMASFEGTPVVVLKKLGLDGNS